MNCADFREELQGRLTHAGRESSAGARAHMEMCASCRAYEKEMTQLDANLRRLPREKVPPHLSDALAAIGRRKATHVPDIGWGPEIRRAGAVLLPVALAWAFNIAPLNALLIFAGTTSLATSILRPRFLATLAPRSTIE
jgi:predicted anti-sigma-YlaC factor YlaD